jgi:hypothetical protein
MEFRKFDFKEFVIVHHVLVDYFKMHSFDVPVAELQSPPQEIFDTAATRNLPETSVRSEFICYVVEPSKKRVPNVWIGDSGASCHMTCSDEGMFNCRVI